MSLRRLLSSRSSSSRRLDKLKPGCSPPTLLEEAKKVLQLSTSPKKLVQLWVCLAHWLDYAQKEVVDTVGRALLHLLVISEYSNTPGFKTEVRKLLSHKAAPLDLKLKVVSSQAIDVLTSDLRLSDLDVISFLRHSCLDYCPEVLFLSFLIKVITYSPAILNEFDFPEVVIVICKHCLAAVQVVRKQRDYTQLSLQLVLKLVKAAWSLHYETRELFMLLCYCYRSQEADEAMGLLMSRSGCLLYAEMLISLLRFPTELAEIQLGAAHHLIQALWLRPTVPCFLSDLLLLQTLYAVKERLKPMFPAITAALSALICRKVATLHCEWMYILGLLLEIWVHTRDPDVKTALQSIACEGDKYQGESTRLEQALAVVCPEQGKGQGTR